MSWDFLIWPAGCDGDCPVTGFCFRHRPGFVFEPLQQDHREGRFNDRFAEGQVRCYVVEPADESRVLDDALRV